MYSLEKVSTFRERFCQLVNESKRTTVQIAKELHVSNQTISAWRTGVRSPKEPTIITIANYFNVSVEWLMGFDVQKETVNRYFPDSKLFSKIILAMSPEDYKTVMDILEKTELEMKERGKL